MKDKDICGGLVIG